MLHIKPLNPRIICADGFSISVQASRSAYSMPRQNYPGSQYKLVECGYPSADPGELMRGYQESPEDPPTNDVYPYVPVEVVKELINDHGGAVKGHLPFYKDPNPALVNLAKKHSTGVQENSVMFDVEYLDSIGFDTDDDFETESDYHEYSGFQNTDDEFTW